MQETWLRLLQEVTNVAISAQSPWLTFQQSAAYAQCSVETIRQAMDAGLIRRYEVKEPKRLIRFRRDDVDRWLAGKASKKGVAA